MAYRDIEAAFWNREKRKNFTLEKQNRRSHVKTNTLKTIEQIVSSFIDSIPRIDSSKIQAIRKAYPFHAAIFSENAILYSKQERSIVTRMGMKLFPTLAKAVAQDRYSKVYTEYHIEAKIDSGCLSRIDTIVNELRAGGGRRVPNHSEEMESINSSQNGKPTEDRIIADLYVEDYKDGPLFMEIKTPMPNLDICAESKKKILKFEAISKKGRGYLAFAYNPYISREKYAHSFTKSVMDLEKEVLMGSEMWNKLGGRETYGELLKVVNKVGESKRRESTRTS